MRYSKNNISHTISKLSTLSPIVFYSTYMGGREGRGIAGDVQRKIPLKHHCCEPAFPAGSLQDTFMRQHHLQPIPGFIILYHANIRELSEQLQRGLKNILLFFSKINSTGVDSGICFVCRGCPQLSLWAVDTEWNLTLFRTMSRLAYIIQLPASPTLLCSQTSLYGITSLGFGGHQCKVLNTCFTKPLSSCIRQLWVTWLCCHEHGGLLGRAKSGSALEAMLQQLYAPGPRSSGAWVCAPKSTRTKHTETRSKHTQVQTVPPLPDQDEGLLLENIQFYI